MYFEIEKKRRIDRDSGYLQVKRKKYQKWTYKRLDTDKFSEAIEWNCVGTTPIRNIQKAVKWLQEIITAACDYAMRRTLNARVYTDGVQIYRF